MELLVAGSLLALALSLLQSESPSAGGSANDGSSGVIVEGYSGGVAFPLKVVPVTTDGKFFLAADVAPAFLAMMQDFYASGGDQNVHVNSAFRNIDSQWVMWNCYQAKLAGQPCTCSNNCETAARPGYSNHQDGTAVDIGGLGGYGTPSYNWFAANASRYGFYNKVSGEYWHWSTTGY